MISWAPTAPFGSIQMLWEVGSWPRSHPTLADMASVTARGHTASASWHCVSMGFFLPLSTVQMWAREKWKKCSRTPYPWFSFLQLQFPTINHSLNILKGKFQKIFISFKLHIILSGVMESCAIVSFPAWDVNHQSSLSLHDVFTTLPLVT
jgi:hypothetical protein